MEHARDEQGCDEKVAFEILGKGCGCHLETVMPGDEENPLEGVPLELYKCTDISRYPTNGLHCKSAKLVDVELTSALCEAKIIGDAEWTRY